MHPVHDQDGPDNASRSQVEPDDSGGTETHNEDKNQPESDLATMLKIRTQAMTILEMKYQQRINMTSDKARLLRIERRT